MHMRICYVLSYRSPDYIRSSSLVSALGNLEEIILFKAINDSTGPARYLETLAKVKRIHKAHKPDIYILGFRGHELYWPLKTIIGSTPIIFDVMMSPSLALAQENQYGRLGKIASWITTPIEKKMLHDCALILTDTQAHADIFSSFYQLSPSKVKPIPVGAIEDAPTMNNPGMNERLKIIFYGSFLPLHGFDYIAQAFFQLKHLPIDLHLIGTNEKIENQLKNKFSNDEHLRIHTKKWVPFKDLIEKELPSSDICLGGPFGNTPQANRVITGKTSQALSQAVPTIIGSIDNNEIFIDKYNCLLVEQGNPNQIKESILWAFNNREKLQQIGNNGRELYQKHLSLRIIKRELSSIISAFEI